MRKRRFSRPEYPPSQPPGAPIPPAQGDSPITPHATRYFRHKNPPTWWPPNEPWPPTHRMNPGGGRNIFLLFGCLFPSVFLLAGFLCAGIFLIPNLDLERVRYLRPAGSLIGAVFLLLLILVLAGNILRRSMRPLGALMDAADSVADGNYTSHLEEHGPPEIRALIHSFNTMTGRLQVYDEQRKRLLADISHELRTPLTILQGNLEGMLDGVYPRDDERLRSLVEETRILARLIEDLRTFTLAETGRLVLEKEAGDPGRLIADLIAALRSQADAAGVELQADVATGIPAVEMDSVRIREVLENLVINALRYTPQSGGVILIGCKPAAGPDRRVEFSVADNGRGIAPEDLPHIFDRYYKSRDSGGSGLGLAITKRLVEAHGGTIESTSTPGSGTTFRFWIPI
jgi:two-component system sensor histidine kinase BaeS